jgi:uncharacterized membrane protein YidH (DUF202 family)
VTDPGRAAERTALGWQRSGLGMGVASAALARAVPAAGPTMRVVLGAVACGAATAAWLAFRASARRRLGAPGRAVATPAETALLATAITLVGMLFLVAAAAG